MEFAVNEYLKIADKLVLGIDVSPSIVPKFAQVQILVEGGGVGKSFYLDVVGEEMLFPQHSPSYRGLIFDCYPQEIIQALESGMEVVVEVVDSA